MYNAYKRGLSLYHFQESKWLLTMTKKLKRKFIIINMSIVLTVALCLFLMTYIFTYSSQKSQSLEYLELAIDNFEGGSTSEDEQSIPSIYSFCVLLDKNGKALKSNNNNEVKMELLSLAVSQALEDGSVSETVCDGELMFLRRDIKDGTIIAFTSTESMDSAVGSAVLLSLYLSIGTVLVFFIVSLFLASYIAKPVKKAWDNQKSFVEDLSKKLEKPISNIIENNENILYYESNSIGSQRGLINSSSNEARKMQGILSQAINLASSENAHSLPLSRVNLSEATRKALLILESSAFDKQISLCSSIAGDVVLCTNEEAYLKIAQTLLNSAIKYSRREKKILISLAKDKQKAYLYVNTSTYLEEKALAHIFEPYSCQDTMEETGGCSALAVASSLASSLNGKLSAKSSAQEGTTFMLTLNI